MVQKNVVLDHGRGGNDAGKRFCLFVAKTPFYSHFVLENMGNTQKSIFERF